MQPPQSPVEIRILVGSPQVNQVDSMWLAAAGAEVPIKILNGSTVKRISAANQPTSPFQAIDNAATHDDEDRDDERRREWITYYWSTGAIEKAYELGWGGEWERKGGGLEPTLVGDDHVQPAPPLLALCSSSKLPLTRPANPQLDALPTRPGVRPPGSPATSGPFSPGVSAGGVLRTGGGVQKTSGTRRASRQVGRSAPPPSRSTQTLCSAMVALLAACGLIVVCIVLFVLTSSPRVVATNDIGSGANLG